MQKLIQSKYPQASTYSDNVKAEILSLEQNTYHLQDAGQDFTIFSTTKNDFEVLKTSFINLLDLYSHNILICLATFLVFILISCDILNTILHFELDFEALKPLKWVKLALYFLCIVVLV